MIAQFQRMIFGQTRERFAGDPDQGHLPFAADHTMEKILGDSHEQARQAVPKNLSQIDAQQTFPIDQFSGHPDVKLLESITGIGVVSAVRLIVEIEDYKRFDSSKALCLHWRAFYMERKW